MKNGLVIALLIMSSRSYGAWDEASGTVASIMTDEDTETILIKLSSNGSAVAECTNSDYFAISKSAS